MVIRIVGEAVVAGKPAGNIRMLVGRVVVENDMDGLALWDRGLDVIQKADELLVTVALHALADDFALQNIEGRKQRRRAVALVIMGHRSGASLLHGQARLSPVERLNLAFPVSREHNRMLGRIDVEPHDVAQLPRELRIVGKCELLDLVRLQAVRASIRRTALALMPQALAIMEPVQ